MYNEIKTKHPKELVWAQINLAVLPKSVLV